jgi:hypothetical protein
LFAGGTAGMSGCSSNGYALLKLDASCSSPVDPLNRKGRRRLVADCRVWLSGRLMTTIRKGFQSDGMSFPWWSRLTWDDPWHDRYEARAWQHD